MSRRFTMRWLLVLLWGGTNVTPAPAVLVDCSIANATCLEGTVQRIGTVSALATGEDMAGMLVTAFFGSLVEAVQFTSDGLTTGAGRAVGTLVPGWELRVLGDTDGFFPAPWTLTNATGYTLDRLVMEAGPNAVFDITGPASLALFPGSSETPGSGEGLALFTTLPLALNIAYIDQVALGASPAAGDLYRQLDVLFNGGLPDGSHMAYSADTDLVTFISVNPVPEPGTLVLLGTGLAGLLSLCLERKYSK